MKSTLRKRNLIVSAITAITWFSGGGLVAKGLQEAGIQVIAGVEGDPDPTRQKISAQIADCYAKNFPDSKLYRMSVQELVRTGLLYQMPKCAIFQVSPSCRKFSVANWQATECQADIECAMAICEGIAHYEPKLFILENVRKYAKSESWQIIKKKLEILGYQIKEQIIDTADFGTPQNRHRFIAIAALNFAPPELKPTVTQHRGWYEAIEDLDLPESHLSKLQAERLSALNLTENPQFVVGRGYQRYATRESHLPSPTMMANRHWPKVLIQKAGVRDKKPVVRSESEPTWTIKASTFTDQDFCNRNHAINAVVDGEVYALTPRAIARLMGVPDSYQLPEAMGLAGTILGNGFPPDAMREIVTQLLPYLEETMKSGELKVGDRVIAWHEDSRRDVPVVVNKLNGNTFWGCDKEGDTHKGLKYEHAWTPQEYEQRFPDKFYALFPDKKPAAKAEELPPCTPAPLHPSTPAPIAIDCAEGDIFGDWAITEIRETGLKRYSVVHQQTGEIEDVSAKFLLEQQASSPQTEETAIVLHTPDFPSVLEGEIVLSTDKEAFYNSLAPNDANWLKEKAATVGELARAAYNSTLSAGEELIAAKERCDAIDRANKKPRNEESTFKKWLEAEWKGEVQNIEAAMRQAQREMQVRRAFNSYPPEAIKKFQKSALYALAGDSCQAAREEAIELAQSPEVKEITHKTAVELIAVNPTSGTAKKGKAKAKKSVLGGERGDRFEGEVTYKTDRPTKLYTEEEVEDLIAKNRAEAVGEYLKKEGSEAFIQKLKAEAIKEAEEVIEEQEISGAELIEELRQLRAERGRLLAIIDEKDSEIQRLQSSALAKDNARLEQVNTELHEQLLEQKNEWKKGAGVSQAALDKIIQQLPKEPAELLAKTNEQLSQKDRENAALKATIAELRSRLPQQDLVVYPNFKVAV